MCVFVCCLHRQGNRDKEIKETEIHGLYNSKNRDFFFFKNLSLKYRLYLSWDVFQV